MQKNKYQPGIVGRYTTFYNQEIKKQGRQTEKKVFDQKKRDVVLSALAKAKTKIEEGKKLVANNNPKLIKSIAAKKKTIEKCQKIIDDAADYKKYSLNFMNSKQYSLLPQPFLLPSKCKDSAINKIIAFGTVREVGAAIKNEQGINFETLQDIVFQNLPLSVFEQALKKYKGDHKSDENKSGLNLLECAIKYQALEICTYLIDECDLNVNDKNQEMVNMILSSNQFVRKAIGNKIYLSYDSTDDDNDNVRFERELKQMEAMTHFKDFKVQFDEKVIKELLKRKRYYYCAAIINKKLLQPLISSIKQKNVININSERGTILHFIVRSKLNKFHCKCLLMLLIEKYGADPKARAKSNIQSSCLTLEELLEEYEAKGKTERIGIKDELFEISFPSFSPVYY